MVKNIKTRFVLAVCSAMMLASCGYAATGASKQAPEPAAPESEAANGPVLRMDKAVESEDFDGEAASNGSGPLKAKADSGGVAIGEKSSSYNITGATLVFGLTADANGATVDLALRAPGADGVLVWWGECKDGVYAPTAPTVAKTAVTKGGTTTVSYRIETTYADGGDSGYISLDRLNDAHKSISATYSDYFVLDDWMHSYRYTDYVYARPYKISESDDGSYTVTYAKGVTKYSVLDYCYNMYSSSSETVQGYIDDIKANGAKAQKAKYGDDAERLSNAEYYKIKVNGAKLADRFSSGLYNEDESVELQKGTYSNWYDSVSLYSNDSIAVSSLLNDHTASELANGITFSNLEGLNTTSDTIYFWGYVMDTSGNYLENAKVTATTTTLDANQYKYDYSDYTDGNGFYSFNVLDYLGSGTYTFDIKAEYQFPEWQQSKFSERTVTVTKNVGKMGMGVLHQESFVISPGNYDSVWKKIYDSDYPYTEYTQTILTMSKYGSISFGVDVPFYSFEGSGYTDNEDEMELFSYWRNTDTSTGSTTESLFVSANSKSGQPFTSDNKTLRYFLNIPFDVDMLNNIESVSYTNNGETIFSASGNLDDYFSVVDDENGNLVFSFSYISNYSWGGTFEFVFRLKTSTTCSLIDVDLGDRYFTSPAPTNYITVCPKNFRVGGFKTYDEISDLLPYLFCMHDGIIPYAEPDSGNLPYYALYLKDYLTSEKCLVIKASMEYKKVGLNGSILEIYGDIYFS